MPETAIDSFILRFVQDQAPVSDLDIESWHGIIRHIQSNQEIRFTQIEDVLVFLANYVDILGEHSPTSE